MNRISCFLSALVLSVMPSHAQVAFDACFNGKQLRMDFALSGNAAVQSAALMQLREEPVWGGPRKNLTDPFEYGGYLLKAYDKASGELVYSRGFNTLFEEWRTTEQAKTETQAWVNSVVMPFPHRPVTAVLLAHNHAADGRDTLMTLNIDPSSIFIERSRLTDHPVTEIRIAGEPAGKVDLAFVAEGYTAAEKDKFVADAQRFTDALFAVPPCNLHREDFNVRAVFLESAESGTDFSGRGIFKNTALNAGFYTFDTERYLTTPDMKSIRDAVWNIPCDAIFVLVNSDVYGGGGMYNFYAIGTADNERTLQVFVHEFGHSFAGLADEYFSFETSDSDFYSLNTEPWEPNITTLVDFDKKWKHMLPPGTPVPTPPEAPYTENLGVFEGGGYLAKGIYRPMNHCMMRNLTPFCPVCSKAIVRMIDYLSDREVSP
jgi:hypothetical protein